MSEDKSDNGRMISISDRATQFMPGKLWSLWDMLEVNGKRLFAAISGLRSAEDIVKADETWLTNEAVTGWIDLIITELGALGCRQTIKKLQSVKFYIENRDPNKQSFAAAAFLQQMKEVWSRLEDEIEDQKVYCLTARDAEALAPVAYVYGAEVEAAFNDLVFDLEEASKAIAFSRGTAGVFHLMRAMEAAVKSAGVKLQVTLVDKDNIEFEWGRIIANMKTRVENMQKGQIRDEWSEVLSLLYHVKQAWRNNTMHPKQTYTMEEAREVLMAVRSFLRRLAPLV